MPIESKRKEYKNLIFQISNSEKNLKIENMKNFKN
jgi:hypothetical protein